MRAKIRTTGAGTEYWDTEEKRTIFVPTGVKPNFKVTDEYESLLDGKDKEAALTLDRKNKSDDAKPADDVESNNTFGVSDGETEYQLNDMTIKKLKELAAANDIDIPKEVTKQKDIAQYIFDNWIEDKADGK